MSGVARGRGRTGQADKARQSWRVGRDGLTYITATPEQIQRFDQPVVAIDKLTLRELPVIVVPAPQHQKHAWGLGT